MILGSYQQQQRRRLYPLSLLFLDADLSIVIYRLAVTQIAHSSRFCLLMLRRRMHSGSLWAQIDFVIAPVVQSVIALPSHCYPLSLPQSGQL